LDSLLFQRYPIYNNKSLKDNITYKVENDSLDWTAFSVQVELLDVEAWNVSPVEETINHDNLEGYKKLLKII
jgi:hypothetical protein